MKNIVDESWRTITQTPRRSTTSGEHPLLAEDFSDVFGGPPRTILSHQFATRFSVSSSSSRGLFYEDIFRQPQRAAVAVEMSGRNLPRFKIPTGKQRSFDGSNFGWDDESLMRSKTSSSSALSSDDDHSSFFAPKLRPINVGNSTRTEPGKHEKSTTFNYENDFLEKLSNYQESFGVSEDDDLHLNSPSSDVSSVSHSDRPNKTCENANAIWRHELVEDEDEEDDNESLCSYVIEINSRNRERACEPNGVDEAIAWAKEKFQTHCSEEKHTKEPVNEHQLSKEHPKSFQPMIQVEMQIQEKKILLWLTGKEDDIRLLLSSLHHILWNNSGWVTISPMNITENSQVKKAYQKAQLCLHPDKLQQRGATVPQKYIAEKVFSALQDAWTAFLS